MVLLRKKKGDRIVDFRINNPVPLVFKIELISRRDRNADTVIIVPVPSYINSHPTTLSPYENCYIGSTNNKEFTGLAIPVVVKAVQQGRESSKNSCL